MGISLCSVALADPVEELPQQSQRDWTRSETKRHHQQIAWDRLRSLAVYTDDKLDYLVHVALRELRKKGETAYADQKEAEWLEDFQGFLALQMFENERDIGDHKPLVQWLENFYDAVEKKLGVELCKMLHLSDIKSINCGIPVVFHPCTFPMDAVTVPRKYEYKDHFAEGQVYYGLVPVVTYWGVSIACMAGTHGAGVGWLCGPIGTAAEWLMAKTLAPALSDAIYDWACSAPSPQDSELLKSLESSNADRR